MTDQEREILDTKIHWKLAELLDDYFPDHKDCECSRCLAFIYGLKDFIYELLKKDEENNS